MGRPVHDRASLTTDWRLAVCQTPYYLTNDLPTRFISRLIRPRSRGSSGGGADQGRHGDAHSLRGLLQSRGCESHHSLRVQHASVLWVWSQEKEKEIEEKIEQTDTQEGGTCSNNKPSFTYMVLVSLLLIHTTRVWVQHHLHTQI